MKSKSIQDELNSRPVYLKMPTNAHADRVEAIAQEEEKERRDNVKKERHANRCSSCAQSARGEHHVGMRKLLRVPRFEIHLNEFTFK